MSAYRYLVHGFAIESEIELPELDPHDGEPEVRIRLGATPERLDGAVTRGPGYQATKGRYLLDVRGIARYCVRDGREVLVAPAPGAAAEKVRLFLLSSVMAAIAHQRGRLALHAGAIDIGGACVLFAGSSGSGKSTLTAAFHGLGHPIVSDDVSVVSFDAGGRPMVHAGGTHVKLNADALDRVGGQLGARARRPGTSKYLVRIREAGSPMPVRIARIYLLARGTAPSIALTPLVGRAKINALVRGTYRFRMLRALQEPRAHFMQCAALAHTVPVVRVERPLDLDGIAQLVRALQQDMRAGDAT